MKMECASVKFESKSGQKIKEERNNKFKCML